MSQARKLMLLDNKQKVAELALRGMHPNVIAEELGLNPSTVRQHIDDTLTEAKEKFINDASRLLVKSYLRTELLIDSLMPAALEGDLASIAMVDKLIANQVKMLKNNSLINVNIGDVNHTFNSIFKHGDATYEFAQQLAVESPHLLVDPLEEFKKVAEEEGYIIEGDFTFANPSSE